MIGGMLTDPLSGAQRAFLASARRATLATIAADGRPRLVPICFVLDAGRPILYTPIDEKAKRHDDPLKLARVRDVQADPRVSVIVDRWDEDWAQLAWLRCHGTASILMPADDDESEHILAVGGLRAKYTQYADHRLEDRPIIRVEIARSSAWGALEPPYG
jgi:PPOX class probable F420-dependent enzyme